MFPGNILWLVLGGLVIALVNYMVGLLMCITIIGIPFGVRLFRLGTCVLWPIGKDLVFGENEPGRVAVVTNPMDYPRDLTYPTAILKNRDYLINKTTFVEYPS